MSFQSLVSYDITEESDSDGDTNTANTDPNANEFRSVPQVNSAPTVADIDLRVSERQSAIDPKCKHLSFNAKYEQLFAPQFGPENPFKSDDESRNFLTGNIEDAHVSDATFELQRKQFHAYGVADNPSDGSDGREVITNNSKMSCETKSDAQKRKKVANTDPSDVCGYNGPWAPYEDESRVAKPTPEESAEIESFMAKKRRFGTKNEEKEFEEKCHIHIEDVHDYQGRSFLHAPHDLDVNLRADHTPNKCFLPKKLLHTYSGHSKALTAIRWFPRSAHLLLSCGMDAKIKLWEVYKERRCVITYLGHKQAVRDIDFNRKGDRFISSGYDRYIKLWDTETGKCIKRFTNRKVAYSIKFNTDEERAHLFLSGMSDKKIVCWDTRSGAIVQEYDRHLGAINTITFVDNNRRFVSTADDKSLRVWEWDIPVDVKYIAEPNMHSMPAVTASPNGKWLACQCMDNKIQAFACMNRFKLNRNKIFTGHMVAGYACSPHFSPDMSFLISGDADGKVFIWNWKTTKLLTHFQAHENVCISTLWHPHETSKVVTAGWDNNIKLWD